LRALITARAIVGVAAGLLLTAVPAHADATYRWEPTSGNGCCEATLVISDEAYAAGFFSTHIANDATPQAITANPVVRFDLKGYGDQLIFDRDHVRGFYDFEITVKGGNLSGDIHANNLAVDTELSGTPTEWAVKSYHSDRPGSCFRVENVCQGDQGHWVLVSAPAKAPRRGGH
jgi:hypothetical protein